MIMTTSPPPGICDDGQMSELTYEEFGRRFFEVAVTEKRVGSAFSAITGDSFDVGRSRRDPAGSPRSRPVSVSTSRRSSATSPS